MAEKGWHWTFFISFHQLSRRYKHNTTNGAFSLLLTLPPHQPFSIDKHLFITLFTLNNASLRHLPSGEDKVATSDLILMFCFNSPHHKLLLLFYFTTNDTAKTLL